MYIYVFIKKYFFIANKFGLKFIILKCTVQINCSNILIKAGLFHCDITEAGLL